MTYSTEADDEGRLITAAQRGDRHAFDSLMGRRRQEMRAHCYRLLASPEDADDAVQDALVRAWRGLPQFERRSSFRTWLFRICTNAALDVARRRSRRELSAGFGPPNVRDPGEPEEWPWVGPFDGDPLEGTPEALYEARETIELAYVATLQHLPARSRAVFVLREVLGFSAAETAEMLETTVASVTSALQRARATLRGRLPETSQQAELSAMGDADVRRLAARYADAIERADLRALMALLTEDVTWSMPPLPSWFSGQRDVAGFLTRFVFPERWAHVTARANGQLAVAGYLFDDEAGGYLPAALDVLELRGGRVAGVTGFLTGEALSEPFASNGLFARFALPPRLEGRPPPDEEAR